jgi:hypothetical protein
MTDETYASPYLAPDELRAIQEERARRGFERDPLVGTYADRRVCGLNVTVAWPLPELCRAAYLDFAARIEKLDPGLYVYSFETTHVTVVTAINFKQHPDPSDEWVSRVERQGTELGNFVASATSDMLPFALEIGPPVLARAAAFFPILNPTGEIFRLRDRVLSHCRAAGGILKGALAPRAVHATFLRFRECPLSPFALANGFESLARGFRLGGARVDEVKVTIELKPYMREARPAACIALGR